MAETAPAPEHKPWEPPTVDQEFKFETIDAAPSWVDKGWASYNQGPALAVPMGDLYAEGPYHTQTARVGDTVKFVAATPSKAAHMVIVPGEPTGENGTIKIPQVSNASLEDMLKGGTMAPDDLGPDAKAQVVGRSPRLKGLVEEGKGAPETVAVTDVVKTS
jgi:hypothetical protein